MKNICYSSNQGKIKLLLISILLIKISYVWVYRNGEYKILNKVKMALTINSSYIGEEFGLKQY